MQSLLHNNDVRSGRTTDATKVPAEKVYNFCSDRLIAPKFLDEFQLAVLFGVAWKPYSSAMMSVWVVPPTRP
jgi:hypothetical protein